jgi:hypothetical protein
MALFVACILCNLNISCYFRITAYDDILGVCHGWQHVYVIANLSSGGQYIIDPVYKAPNEEKEYSKKEDYLITIMGLNGCDIYQLSGLGTTTYYEDEFGGLNGRKKRKERKAKRKEKKRLRKEGRKEKRAAKKAIKKAKRSGDKEALKKAKAAKKAAKQKINENRTGIAKAAIKVANFMKKGAMLVPRSMFLLLIRLNFRGMATKFANNENAYSKFVSTWKKVFGGKEKKLKKAVNKGRNKKALFGSKKNMGNLTADLVDIGNKLCGLGAFEKIRAKLNRLFRRDKQLNGLEAISYDILDGLSELGTLGEPTTCAVGAAIASATPIIKKAIDIFKKVNDAIPETAKEALKEGFSTLTADDDENINYESTEVEEEDAEEEEYEE